jgi:hypothetical protein
VTEIREILRRSGERWQAQNGPNGDDVHGTEPLDAAAVEERRECVHQRDHHVDGEEEREELVLEEQADRDVDALAQPAGAHEAEHGRGPDVDLPAIEGVGEELRPGLGQDAVEEDGRPSRAARLQSLERARVDILEDFAEELSEETPGVAAQREGRQGTGRVPPRTRR